MAYYNIGIFYDEDDRPSDVEEVFLEDEDKKTKREFNANPDLKKRMLEMFPDICPNYLLKICNSCNNSSVNCVNHLTSRLLCEDYPKRKPAVETKKKINSSEILSHLKEVLPNADPNFLEMKSKSVVNYEELESFIFECLEKKNYPSVTENLRKNQISAQQKQYTTNFDVKMFLEVFPNPFEYFRQPSRKSNVKDKSDEYYTYIFLRNKFPFIFVKYINNIPVYEDNLVNICEKLETVRFQMKYKRSKIPLPEFLDNIPLLQEIAFINHQKEIKQFLDEQSLREKKERLNARSFGLLATCNCCFDDEVMSNELVFCNNGCIFCKNCVTKSVEMNFGEGILRFSCLAQCDSEFSLQDLQKIISPKLFSKLALKKQIEEVKAAGIDDLESCPFCDFLTIPAPGDKLFKCFNPECMKESCRKCKEPSHIPLRCEEVEKDENVVARCYIEDKMSEALIRKCHQCNRKFVKSEDGCNKITCVCGAFMCYICCQPVKDYQHFNGQGGSNHHLCPLFSDTNELHKTNVLKSAKEAKAGLSGSVLKVDPTADIEKYYNNNDKKSKDKNLLP